jgi:hypothetical protein
MTPTAIVRPDNPGTYIALVGDQTVRPSPNLAQTVAIPIVHDWGPLCKDEGPILLNSFGEFDAIFGNGATSGRDAVLGAFVGPGVPGEPGAGGVLVYRMASGSAKAAKIIIKNTAEAPASALELTALFTGERGNRISAAVETDPANEVNDRLRILFDGVTVERYSYSPTNITELAEAINARASKYVTAEKVATGVKLAHTAGTTLAEGNNGSTLTVEQWDEALASLEFKDFSIFAPFDLTDSSILAVIFSWVQTQAEQMRPVTCVVGGKDSETIDEAITRTAALRDPHFISVAGGQFHDDFLDKDVDTSQLAPRIAGVVAGRGEESSLTFCPMAGLHQIGTVNITTDELQEAAEAGLTVFRRTTREDADLIIARGVTTFISKTDKVRPYELFSDPRIVRVGDLFLRRMKDWGDQNIVGPTRVLETTKVAVRQQGQKELEALVRRGLIEAQDANGNKPFFRIVEQNEVPDAIVFEFGWIFVRTTNYLIGTGKVS